MSNPKVSVLIPAYNYAQYLPEAIDSVLAQTFEDFEILIVDNCSTDNTEEIIMEYLKKDRRIQYFKNEENIGPYRNYNQCLLYASGEYIKFLNADDKFAPTLLEKFVSILDNNHDIAIITSYRQYFGSKTDILKTPYKGQVESKTAILSSLKYGNWIGEPTTVMFRRKHLNLGLFDISLLPFADQDMWLRHLRVGSLYTIDEVLSYFRIHDEMGTFQISNNKDKRYFNILQYAEYRRNAILNHRFGYNLYTHAPKEARKILNDATKRIVKLIETKTTSIEPLAYLYRFIIVQKFFQVAITPDFIYRTYAKLNAVRKTIKAFFKVSK
ncbi:glycosyltransferase family 2 protein [Sulfuricurvum sp.]|uniref:glycosyltransferase family 2 protein n=1 Tax=Sulfuricurvum sp. TaxID=2025608 RepID=UPI003C6A64B5